MEERDAMIVQQQEINAKKATSDQRVIILARGLRTFGYGFTSVLLGVMLSDAGMSAVQIGILLAVAALGSITFSLVMGMFADHVGRKRSLVVSAILMMGTGFVFAFTQFYPLLLLAAFCGTISPSTNDNTPFSGIEQAVLAQSTSTERHTSVFARYNLVAQLAGAMGSLVVGLPIALSYAGIAASINTHFLFALYGMLAGSTALLFLLLSPAAELQRPKDTKLYHFAPAAVTRNKRQKRQKPKIGGLILKLSSLFAVDAFAGGLVAQTILAIWFHLRFGASLGSLGLLFFCVNIMAALSCLTAPWLTRQLGLLKAMIIPHFISNIFLLLVPFMPTFLLAITFLLLRQTLSKLDVPARQAYTMMLVSPEERTAAASFTTTSRSVAVSTSPLVSGLMLSGSIITLGLPILLASCIEISYDAILWIVFRQVPLDITAKAERKLSTQFHHLHFPGRATYAYSPSWHFAQPLHFGQETLSPRFQPTYTPQTMTSEQFWFLQLPSATTPYRVDPIAVERVQDSSAGF
jgi:MFS family permease